MEAIATEGQLRLGLGIAEDSLSAQERALLGMLHPMVEQAIRNELQYDPVQASRIEYYPVQELPYGEPSNLDINLPPVEVIAGQARSIIQSSTAAKILCLRHLPVRSIASIRYNPDGRFGQGANAFDVSNTSVTTLVSGTDYWLEMEEPNLSLSGILEHTTSWPTERGSLQITYTAGYTRDERQGWGQRPCSDLIQAVVVTFAKAWKSARQSWQHPLTGGVMPGPIASESLQDYSVSYDNATSSLIAGMKISIPNEARELLNPYLHYGRDLI